MAGNEPENVPCKVRRRTDLPLHVNRQCAARGPDDLPASTAVVWLPCYGITIGLERNRPTAQQPGCGTITSDIQEDLTGEGDAEYLAVIDGLQSLILVHPCAGTDGTAAAYLEGLEAAVNAVSQAF
jgi:hypothetical protein